MATKADSEWRTRKEKIDVFLKHMMLTDYVQNQFHQASHGAIMRGLNTGIVKGAMIFLPPLASQEEFATTVNRIEGIQRGQARSATEISDLFHSLMQRAFRGELAA